MKAHLFVCTNKPDKPGKCGNKGSEDLRAELKQRCKDAFGKNEELRINSSGCLGFCERGITAVLYPEGKWFVELSSKDRDRLFEEVSRAMKGKSEQ